MECRNDLSDIAQQVSDRAGTARVTSHGPVGSYSGGQGEGRAFSRITLCVAVSYRQ